MTNHMILFLLLLFSFLWSLLPVLSVPSLWTLFHLDFLGDCKSYNADLICHTSEAQTTPERKEARIIIYCDFLFSLTVASLSL